MHATSMQRKYKTELQWRIKMCKCHAQRTRVAAIECIFYGKWCTLKPRERGRGKNEMSERAKGGGWLEAGGWRCQ